MFEISQNLKYYIILGLIMNLHSLAIVCHELNSAISTLKNTCLYVKVIEHHLAPYSNIHQLKALEKLQEKLLIHAGRKWSEQCQICSQRFDFIVRKEWKVDYFPFMALKMIEFTAFAR